MNLGGCFTLFILKGVASQAAEQNFSTNKMYIHYCKAKG